MLQDRQFISSVRQPLATRDRLRPVDNILEAIGSTPLIRLQNLFSGVENQDRAKPTVYGKYEAANPGGSAKDRPARRMLEAALRDGRIDSQTLIVESSSGNMGIGVAQFCRYHQLRFRCVVDPRTQKQNLAMLRALGAELDMITEPDPASGDFLVARLNRVHEILRMEPKVFWPNQYANRENSRAHQYGTMPEIHQALDGRYDLVFVATSSTGTAGGCADYIREVGGSARVIAVDAVGSVLFGGAAGNRAIPGLGAGIEPDLARKRRFDRVVRVSALDCVVGARRLAQREGILAGGSAGGVIQAVTRYAPHLAPGGTCVAVLADGGTRYLDTIYDDSWVEQQLGCAPEELARRVAGQSSIRSAASRM